MTYMKSICCFLIIVGLGWVFAEIRRFFFHTYYFLREADENRRGNFPISLVCGLAFLFVGTVLAYNGFGFGRLVFTFQYPYLDAGPESHRFLIGFGSGTVSWMVLSAISTKFLPLPLFDETIAERLSNWVRGILFVIWSAVLLLGLRHGGSLQSAWGFGLIPAAAALFAIITGSLWWEFTMWEWEVPMITCQDRPFPYAATVLLLIGAAAFCLLGPFSPNAPKAIISAP